MVVGLYVVGIIAQFAVADWGQASGRLLPILLAGILVGFAEETLFRGVILRSLRTNLRPEAWVMLISSVWFGLFHLVGVLNGLDVVSAVIQVGLASVGGVIYYLFRRAGALLVYAMLAHGLWDTSLFLPAPTGSLKHVDTLVFIVVVLSALVAAIVIVRRDRSLTVTRTGVRAGAAAGMYGARLQQGADLPCPRLERANNGRTQGRQSRLLRRAPWLAVEAGRLGRR